MYTCIETKCGADNVILPRFDCVPSSNRIRYSLWAPRETSFDNGRKRAVYSPYNRILLSTSPREFLAAHRYVPTSFFCKFRIMRLIRTSNGDFVVIWTLCLTLDIIIEPGEQSEQRIRLFHLSDKILSDKKTVVFLYVCVFSIFID